MPTKKGGGQVGFYPSIADPKARIQQYIDTYLEDPTYDGFEAHIMRTIKLLSVTQNPHSSLATTVFEIPVTPKLCSPMDNMHGGCVATLADMATTMATAPLAQKGFWEFGGVSRTLNVTYLKPVRLGYVVRVECEVRSIGKRLSVIQCVMREKETGETLALAEHGKSALQDQTFPDIPIAGQGHKKGKAGGSNL